MFEDTPAIAILGSERAERDSDLEAARAIGRSLAELGYSVLVSGRRGVAEAAAEGVRQGGGKLIVVGDPGELGAEAVLEARGPLRRMQQALDVADAMVLLSPNLDAMAMLMQVWAFALTKDAPFRQVVLFGGDWPERVQALAAAARVDRRVRSLVTFATGVAETVSALRYYVGPEDRKSAEA